MDDKPHYHDEVDLPPLADIEVDDPDYDPFEALLIEAQERRVLSYGDVCALCAEAVQRGRTSTAADFFHQGKGWVYYRAKIFNVFGLEAIQPHIPVDLYAKAMKAAKGKGGILGDPRYWLRMATDAAYRSEVLGYDDEKDQWSARDLANFAGITAGKKVSDVPLIPAGTEGLPTVWENRIDADGEMAAYFEMVLPGVAFSGKAPERVRMGKVVEVLK